jgi:hypothetical protein
MISTFWWNVLAAAIGQTIILIFSNGFIRSYLGIKSEEDVQKIFDKLYSLFKKKSRLMKECDDPKCFCHQINKTWRKENGC